MYKRKLLPIYRQVLETFGENIKYARLRRDLSESQLAKNAQVSRSTLVRIEKGESSVSLDSYFRVLIVLGLAKELANIGAVDEYGRLLQDQKLTKR